MYLKRLESVGFKSFAKRINVEFVPGVTAVVGPNGSGKSNITDAIRWVLGEQSAKSLRGSRMEDIIFQGSDSRSALNVAEVTLVLDNHDKELPLDYEEISVTRRVYRSGDSEFYLNKQSCRLKDIIDLFMDSGLGREAFSIISQGKVEEILSSKAEERRSIFEEAAGVLKYKQRKKKAEYKLAETQENLNRIEDIIHEIEQQINPLKEQAETAEKYIDLKDQLKEKEISYLITEIETYHEQWQTLLDELEKEKMEEIQIKTAIQKKEAGLEDERQKIVQLDEEVEVLQASLLTVTQQLEHYEGRKQLYNERTRNFTENKEKLKVQKQETEMRIASLQEELKVEKEKLAELQEIKQKTNKIAEELEMKLATDEQNIADKIEELKTIYIENLNVQAAKRNETNSISQQLQQISGKKERQSQKFQSLIEHREKLSREYKETQDKYYARQNYCAVQESQMKQLKNELEQQRKHFQESQEKLYKGFQYIEKLKSKKEMLEEMKEDFQGFFNGVKAVLKAREEKQLQQIHGAVIELIDIPKKYITAMETVLGGQAQHIVVSDDESARSAISWLKKTNNGRATFLPLKSIQERFITRDVLTEIQKHSGFVGTASSLVETDDRFKKCVNHLMGHVVIAETLKDANEIAGKVKRRYRVVTLDGDVVHPGGSMSGGAKKRTNQSLFTREKDLQEITEKLDEVQGRAERFEEMVSSLKLQLSHKEKELEQKELSITEAQQELQKVQEAHKELEMQLASLNNNLSIYDQDKQQFNQDRGDLQSRQRQLTEDLDGISQQLQSTQAEIDSLTRQQEEFKENQEQMRNELHKNQVSLAEQEERLKSQREKTDSVKKLISENQLQLEEFTSELDDLISFNKSDETEEEIDQTIENNKEEKTKITTSIQEKRKQRSERTKLTQDQERELKEENKKHQSFIQEIQQKEVKANRLDVELENRLSRLQTEYTITYEKAKQNYKKAEEPEQAKSVVQQLKQRIEQLGTVNLGAIDEYDRVKTRYTFLTEQKDDLVEAKQTLFAVISEMDEEMQKRFDSTFTQIKQEFAIVFKQLFGGGHAELKLTDPKNLLDTGVDIIAQPPGKKLQHLGLLSGGERALTAISLLFAILRVRPVPFCVLDEVEAALDEANVVRFAKYVKLYSKQTQFIVITHRKGTMEEADVLYGVTMQESGVSRLVSVRLEDTKELIQS
ncbi:chromosome segregation protein SMC [Virgibacillus indicus]|uniref:Chromosome partition protein Smc n=1 Tax=Virgibacillus indicus TaxID=2024554 RepID=A0A265NFV0_9BACI|nr:chromosome segregation protein SMC [Virgibacillus indicus]OZU90349.1 chromosome segregation protein SMC [Virgibacillus indicus]